MRYERLGFLSPVIDNIDIWQVTLQQSLMKYTPDSHDLNIFATKETSITVKLSKGPSATPQPGQEHTLHEDIYNNMCTRDGSETNT